MALTQVDQGLLAPQAQYTGFKNRIINGAMMIDQRNAGAAITGVTAATGRVYSVDRNGFNNYSDAICTTQQSTTVPAGFKNSLYATVTTADASVGATQFCAVEQRIEGLNVADLGWGTANAQSVTLSFWVRSSLTGTYCAAIYNSSGARSYVATYTINAADTWEYKTITIAGDTTGTWLTTNGIGLHLSFCLGVGSSYQQTAGSWGSTAFAIGTSTQANWIGTLNATFYITGVQLEKGSTATSFDYRPYGTELALCQRYYYKQQSTTNFTNFGMGRAYTTTGGQAAMSLPVSMRAAPTGSYSALADFNSANGTITAMSPAANIGSDFRWVMIDMTLTAAVATGTIALNANNNNNAWMAWSAEL